MLNDNEDGAKLVQKYHNKEEIPVSDKDRNEIINLALGYVIKQIGNYYPKSSTKENLAKAIVTAFPQMGLVQEGLPSHEYIYNSATANAYIDQHLKRMRYVAVPINERKRKSSTKEKVVKDKGKTSKRKSVAASTIDLEEDHVNQCKVEVYYKTTTTFVFYFSSASLSTF